MTPLVPLNPPQLNPPSHSPDHTMTTPAPSNCADCKEHKEIFDAMGWSQKPCRDGNSRYAIRVTSSSGVLLDVVYTGDNTFVISERSKSYQDGRITIDSPRTNEIPFFSHLFEMVRYKYHIMDVIAIECIEPPYHDRGIPTKIRVDSWMWKVIDPRDSPFANAYVATRHDGHTERHPFLECDSSPWDFRIGPNTFVWHPIPSRVEMRHHQERAKLPYPMWKGYVNPENPWAESMWFDMKATSTALELLREDILALETMLLTKRMMTSVDTGGRFNPRNPRSSVATPAISFDMLDLRMRERQLAQCVVDTARRYDPKYGTGSMLPARQETYKYRFGVPGAIEHGEYGKWGTARDDYGETRTAATFRYRNDSIVHAVHIRHGGRTASFVVFHQDRLPQSDVSIFDPALRGTSLIVHAIATECERPAEGMSCYSREPFEIHIKDNDILRYSRGCPEHPYSYTIIGPDGWHQHIVNQFVSPGTNAAV